MEEKHYIKGELLHIIYHQEESLYTVAKLKVKDATEGVTDKEVIVVGMMSKPEKEQLYEVSGVFHEHARFGKQYKFETYKKVMPDTKQGLVLYFSSDMFPGVGVKMAERIVDEFGVHAISTILADPDSLNRVPKLPEDKQKMIVDQLLEDQGIEQVLLKLHEYGFGLQLALKIFKTYQHDALRIIESNPYQMVQDVEGIGFVKADQIGQKQGITGNHPDRVKAAILFVLFEQTMNNGHVYIHTRDVVQRAQDLLAGPTPIDPMEIADQVILLGEEEKVIVVNDNMYMPSLYYAEQGIATNIRRILFDSKEIDPFPEAELLKALGGVEEKLSITYAESQKKGIETALASPMMILTGGPGTGKTTVIKGIIEVFATLHGISIQPDDYKGKQEPFPVIMAAPTGRAAKRMKESTGLPASTIHRLLGYKGEEDSFEKDEENQLEGKILILDEMSMVDTWLANQLLRAVPKNMQVIIVGDEDQLPSVGPGQVLTDLLKSEIIPAVKLTDIYRQSSDSHIVPFSHGIKSGELPSAFPKESKDLRFFPCEQEQVIEAVEKICRGAITKGFTARDIQVLAPMYRGQAGIDALNQRLQELFNPLKERQKHVKLGELSYRVGDMVLQLVNNPEENVFNGDRGEIVAILTEKETADKTLQVVIAFDEVEVTYSRQDLNQVTHAYCCSIHKSQGSEFPIIIMPVVRGYHRMLRRKLLYTGITRAKNFLLLCGDYRAMKQAVDTTAEDFRQTTLFDRLNTKQDVEEV
ncbi:SF1B family DNA helicase RecD2 [Paenalkalicoccus suaedae]|uniref:SF1B family DNA helicase RecD2 n=1 Tax=Paenalkalicoccus suaedae TaxID=2592382 RepID=UPI003D32046A